MSPLAKQTYSLTMSILFSILIVGAIGEVTEMNHQPLWFQIFYNLPFVYGFTKYLKKDTDNFVEINT